MIWFICTQAHKNILHLFLVSSASEMLTLSYWYSGVWCGWVVCDESVCTEEDFIRPPHVKACLRSLVSIIDDNQRNRWSLELREAVKASESKRCGSEASVRIHQSRLLYRARELKHMYVSVRGYMFITATGSLFSGKQTVKTLPSFSLLASVHETHLQSSLSSGINYKPLFLSTFGVINPHHRLH